MFSKASALDWVYNLGVENTLTKIVFPIIAIVAIGGLIWFGLANQNNTAKPIGGYTDEHGCLPAAGYSWNEDRQQCVRGWEVPMMEEAESAVRSQLALKYDKPLSEVTAKGDQNRRFAYGRYS